MAAFADAPAAALPLAASLLAGFAAIRLVPANAPLLDVALVPLGFSCWVPPFLVSFLAVLLLRSAAAAAFLATGTFFFDAATDVEAFLSSGADVVPPVLGADVVAAPAADVPVFFLSMAVVVLLFFRGDFDDAAGRRAADCYFGGETA